MYIGCMSSVLAELGAGDQSCSHDGLAGREDGLWHVCISSCQPTSWCPVLFLLGMGRIRSMGWEEVWPFPVSSWALIGGWEKACSRAPSRPLLTLRKFL